MSTSLLQRWAKDASTLLAADAGADILLAAGLVPTAVIGDLDSVENRADWQQLEQSGKTRLIPMDEQETTDCDKLLAYAESLGHTAITLIGVEGDRLDHVLATVHSAAKSSIDVRFALRTGVAWVLNDGDSFKVNTKPGRTVSVIPITECSGVRLSGVEWPLCDAGLSPLGSTSISNRAAGTMINVGLSKGALLLVVELPENEAPWW